MYQSNTDQDRPTPALSDSAAALRVQITRAMQAAALQERERMLVGIAEVLGAHEVRIRDRASEEAAALRRTAGEDIDAIERRSKDEIARIRAETQQQVAGRRGQLEQSLAGHGAVIDREVDGVRQAVDGYRAGLDEFFVRLTNEADPSEIARLAALLPAGPDLDEIGASARADAVTDLGRAESERDLAGVDQAGPAPVGVMDPRAAGRNATMDFGPAAAAGHGDAAPGEATDSDVAGREAELAAAAAPAGEERATVRFLRSIAPWAVSNADRETEHEGEQPG
jgi:hypothetical protein